MLQVSDWKERLTTALTPAQKQALGLRLMAIDLPHVTAGDGASGDVLHLALPRVTEKRLNDFSPDVVVFPLFGADHDATMIIETLEALGYAGRLAVLAPSLPRPDLVERELRGLGPGKRLTLISLG